MAAIKSTNLSQISPGTFFVFSLLGPVHRLYQVEHNPLTGTNTYKYCYVCFHKTKTHSIHYKSTNRNLKVYVEWF